MKYIDCLYSLIGECICCHAQVNFLAWRPHSGIWSYLPLCLPPTVEVNALMQNKVLIQSLVMPIYNDDFSIAIALLAFSYCRSAENADFACSAGEWLPHVRYLHKPDIIRPPQHSLRYTCRSQDSRMKTNGWRDTRSDQGTKISDWSMLMRSSH